MGVHSSHGASQSHVSRHPEPQPGPPPGPPTPSHPTVVLQLGLLPKTGLISSLPQHFQGCTQPKHEHGLCSSLPEPRPGGTQRGGLSPDAVPFGLGPIPSRRHGRLPKQRWLLSPCWSQPSGCWARGPPQVRSGHPPLPTLHVPVTFSDPLKSQEIGVKKDAGNYSLQAPASTCEESRPAEARRVAPGPHHSDLEDGAFSTFEVASPEGAGPGATQPPARCKDLPSFPAKHPPGDGVMTQGREAGTTCPATFLLNYGKIIKMLQAWLKEKQSSRGPRGIPKAATPE